MNNDQPRTEPTPALRAPIIDRKTAEAFITELCSLGLDYHFDDRADDCLRGVVTKQHAHMIQAQVDACYTHWNSADLMVDCPIGFALKAGRFRRALDAARWLLVSTGLEPTSAFKQAASDEGIEYGDDMGEFVAWAHTQIIA